MHDVKRVCVLDFDLVERASRGVFLIHTPEYKLGDPDERTQLDQSKIDTYQELQSSLSLWTS
jgi:hypothetical protein